MVRRSSKYSVACAPIATWRSRLCAITSARNVGRTDAYCSRPIRLSRVRYCMCAPLIDQIQGPVARPLCLLTLLAERVQRLLEAVGGRAVGLGQGLEPVGDLREPLVAAGLAPAPVHVGVLVGLAGDRRLQVVGGRADRQGGGRGAGPRPGF